MTNKEIELVEYLKGYSISNDNTVLIEKNILEKSISYLFENEIKVKSISSLNVSEEKVLKIENSFNDYSNKKISIEEIMSDVKKLPDTVTHYEMSLELKKSA